MNLLNAMHPECVQAQADCANRDDVLAAIARLAKQSPVLKNMDEPAILKGLIDREELSTTGFGGGIAIPHCRLGNVKDFVVGILSVPSGAEFNAMDGKPVKLFVFIIAPSSGSNEHIKILSAISQVLNVPQHVGEMLMAPTAEVLAENFLRHIRDEADSKQHDTKNLFRVQIQDEDLFHDVIKIFASFNASTVMVTEAEPAANYIQKMPLFAGFWSDKQAEFCKVILATVDKQDTNETIRRIEQKVGSLDERDDMLLTVQELFYCAGSLNI
ncbi:PTS sugar transporter subunit IIA [Pontiella sulfatireligans]|uniref:Nitrogen regulatory protein n=1 Tax=Pontiella sulfatireligans TaxID=2750658 RepID=A0A6C2UQX5_9BACT|nr:PTS sugar transporter subunit IIA [Pontiella sulfatireligans]VGO21386.1 Nitrogen regulatory protein [Pontiella sulfatireligans]